jgi:hypothetical protein
MYKILRVLNINGSHPNTRMYVDSGTREKDSSELEKPPPWKDTVVHTTSCGILRNAHSSSH